MKKLILVPLVLLLTGCSTYVKDKFEIPEFERTHEECFTHGRYGCQEGKELVVKVPKCWRITLYNWGGWDSDICVDEQTWKNTQVGQEWTSEGYN